MPILLKNIQDVHIAKRVNYEFVKVINITEKFNVYLLLFLPYMLFLIEKKGTA